MPSRQQWSVETEFEESGSLPRPGPLGRLIRVGLGIWLLWFFVLLVTQGPAVLISTTVPQSWSFWLVTAFIFWVTPYVINIGFTRRWRRKPQGVVLGIVTTAVVIDLISYGTWWAPPLGVFLLGWLLYISGHLGFSLVLSGLIATPGCEMRAVPHLWTMITGRQTKEHYCPGPLDKIDQWETRRAGS